MKIAYAFRRSILFPYVGDDWNLPGREVRARWLKQVREMGFDGIEIANNTVGGPDAPDSAVRTLRDELDGSGVPCVCVRGGGGLNNARYAVENRQRLEDSITFASKIGTPLVNTTVGGPTDKDRPGSFVGDPISQGSSRQASASDFEVTAKGFREAGKRAADL